VKGGEVMRPSIIRDIDELEEIVWYLGIYNKKLKLNDKEIREYAIKLLEIDEIRKAIKEKKA